LQAVLGDFTNAVYITVLVVIVAFIIYRRRRYGRRMRKS
jgi:hypothetical protein